MEWEDERRRGRAWDGKGQESGDVTRNTRPVERKIKLKMVTYIFLSLRPTFVPFSLAKQHKHSGKVRAVQADHYNEGTQTGDVTSLKRRGYKG